MHIDVNGWLDAAKVMPSPNFNDRPLGTKVSLLVIHNASLPPEVWGVEDIIALFQNKLDCTKHPYYAQLEGRKVSAHFLIDRAGRVYQLVSVLKRAWHAGVSSFAQMEDCNNYSIGIELNGSDKEAYTKEQYVSLIELTQALMRTFPEITLERITGHEDIALPKGRKTDPGPFFDWDYYKQLLQNNLSDYS